MLHIMIALISFSGFAQERSLSVELDREQILIGEQVTMTVTLKGSSADSLQLPTLLDTLRKEIEIVAVDTPVTTYEGAQLDQQVKTQTMIITSFDSGYFAVEPLVGSINGDSILSNPFLLTVQTIQIDTAKGIVDIKDIEEVPFAWKEWFKQHWYWFALGIVALALITIIALYLSKEKPKEEEVIIEVIRPAHEIALERLAALKEKELWQKGEIKLFYIELTDILREFIEARFSIPALEQTTDEIVVNMSHYPDFSDDQRTTVKRLLFLADLVKFAKEKPIDSENEQHLSTVESFVNAFVPSEQIESEENG